MGYISQYFSVFIHFHIAWQVHKILGLIAIANSAWVLRVSTEPSLPCMHKTLIHMRAETKSYTSSSVVYISMFIRGICVCDKHQNIVCRLK